MLSVKTRSYQMALNEPVLILILKILNLKVILNNTLKSDVQQILVQKSRFLILSGACFFFIFFFSVCFLIHSDTETKKRKRYTVTQKRKEKIITQKRNIGLIFTLEIFLQNFLFNVLLGYNHTQINLLKPILSYTNASIRISVNQLTYLTLC